MVILNFYTYVLAHVFFIYLKFYNKVLLNKDEFSRIEFYILVICTLGQWFAEPLAFIMPVYTGWNDLLCHT